MDLIQTFPLDIAEIIENYLFISNFNNLKSNPKIYDFENSPICYFRNEIYTVHQLEFKEIKIHRKDITDFIVFKNYSISCSEDNINIYDLNLDKIVRTIKHDGSCRTINLIDPYTLVGKGNKIWIWDFNSGDLLKLAGTSRN